METVFPELEVFQRKSIAREGKARGGDRDRKKMCGVVYAGAPTLSLFYT